MRKMTIDKAEAERVRKELLELTGMNASYGMVHASIVLRILVIMNSTNHGQCG